MRVIIASNVNEAWRYAKGLLTLEGVKRDSRNGPVLEHPEPVTTCYKHSNERVLFDPVRDANPFFHLMEGLWMLAGRNDVAWIEQYNKRMMSYSDDGKTFHAAYGYRWRSHFDFDQFTSVIEMLKADHDSRRAVIQMWDPNVDLWSPEEIQRRGSVPKDLPCNTSIYFKIRDGKLMMTVANRSNDIVWGCYGANVVHMSMLHEYMAAMIGVKLGAYYQISDSWHAYLETWDKQDFHGGTHNLYRGAIPVWPYQMVTHPEYFDDDLGYFMDGPNLDEPSCMNPFFHDIVIPMRSAWFCYKEKRFDCAVKHLARMPYRVDWRVAAEQWIDRRANADAIKRAHV